MANINIVSVADAVESEPAKLLDEAVAEGRVPGGVLAAGVRTAEPQIFHVAGHAQRDAEATRAMTGDTVFDLASLTKIVATLPCVLHLVGAGEICLDHAVARYLPEFASSGKDLVTVRHLLAHTAGLPAHREYYRHLAGAEKIIAAALAEPLVSQPGSTFCYSDVGFIALGEMCSRIAGPLPELVERIACEPTGMSATRYLPPQSWAGRIAATEPEQGHAKVGVVHDENAAAMGGVSGHAGLFGTAADLARYAAAWIDTGSRLVPPWLRERALASQTNGLPGADGLAARRGLGWVLRGDRWDNMGDGWPGSGAGHTGFTGTSLSIDPVSGLWAVLLTNAVHFGRDPEHSVVGLRKKVHAAVAAALIGE